MYRESNGELMRKYLRGTGKILGKFWKMIGKYLERKDEEKRRKKLRCLRGTRKLPVKDYEMTIKFPGKQI